MELNAPGGDHGVDEYEDDLDELDAPYHYCLDVSFVFLSVVFPLAISMQTSSSCSTLPTFTFMTNIFSGGNFLGPYPHSYLMG